MAFLFAARAQSIDAGSKDRAAPFILSNALLYLDEPSRFLRELANGQWRGGRAHSDFNLPTCLPSDNTIRAKAAALENFWSYTESKVVDWRRLNYDDVLRLYDADMATGTWSQNGKPLAASTINLRVGVVCDFLTWAHERGYRPQFDIPTKDYSRVGPLRKGRSFITDHHSARIGRHRLDPRHLRLPSRNEINTWLREVTARHGPSKNLACQTILNTGMRLEECVLLRAAQVNDALIELRKRKDLADEHRWVGLEICFGTKGGRRPGDIELRGKSRILRVHPQFLERLERYMVKVRPFALERFKSANPGERLPMEVFLSARSGQPISRAALYKSWHDCRSLPFAGWSPHLGRHAWACFMLLSHVEKERRLLTAIAASGALPTSWAMQIATDFINIVLRPAMGHVSERTTETYLGWLDAHLSGPDVSASWSEFLEDGYE